MSCNKFADIRIPRNVYSSLRLWKALYHTKKVTPNQFGDLQSSSIPISRLNPVNHRMKGVENENMKEISYPTRHKIEHVVQSSKTGKLVIECARKEFNFHEGMYIERNIAIPLCSEFWDKNKYKNEWFTIHRKTKNTSLSKKLNDLGWDDMVPDMLDIHLREVLQKKRIIRPTDIQIQCLHSFKSLNHLFIAAETGSGKTLAFALPLATYLIQAKRKGLRKRAVILCVTSSLKDQTTRVLNELVEGTNLCISTPGTSNQDNWDILIGTPGLVSKELASIDPTELSQIVMDEADMLLDESFTDVLTEIFSRVPISNSQTNLNDDKQNGARIVFASASCPEELECLAEGIVDRSSLSFIKSRKLHHISANVTYTFIRVREMDKLSKLREIIEKDLQRGLLNQTVIFCKDRKTAHFVLHDMKSIFGDIVKRDAADINTRIIIATDSIARGMDLPMLSHVINYDLSRHTVDFLHRCGRVGRLHSEFVGRVTSFVRTPWEVNLTKQIELSARLGLPLSNIEADVSGMIKNKQAE